MHAAFPLFVSGLGLLGLPAAAQCPSTSTAIVEQAELTTQALENTDEPTIENILAQIEETLSCLDEPISQDAAVAYHQIMAFQSFYVTEFQQIPLSLQAILQLDPDYQPPAAFLSLQFEDRMAEAMALQAAVFDLEIPSGYGALVDSEPRVDFPANRPAILQWLAADAPQSVLATHYIQPNDSIPSPPPLRVINEPPPKENTSRHRRRLAWGTGGAALASGLLWSSAVLLKQQYFPENPSGVEDLDPTLKNALKEGALTKDSEYYAPLNKHRNQVNALSIGGGAASALTLGLGVALVVSW